MRKNLFHTSQKHSYLNLIYSSTTTKKLKRTLQFVQDLERAHLFEDANLRTFAMLLFNWILIIWLHQSPMIWFDPNNLDLFSISELTSSVQKGQRVFQEIKTRLSFRKHLKCRVRDLGFQMKII